MARVITHRERGCHASGDVLQATPECGLEVTELLKAENRKPRREEINTAMGKPCKPVGFG